MNSLPLLASIDAFITDIGYFRCIPYYYWQILMHSILLLVGIDGLSSDILTVKINLVLVFILFFSSNISFY